MSRTRVAVFASGRGSNFKALVEATRSGDLDATIALLVCDQPLAPVIGTAAHYGIPVLCIWPGLFDSKVEYELAIARALNDLRIDWVALAGYMRIVGPTLLGERQNRIVNIHPSLLPSFPGRNAIEAAFEAGATSTGVTIHLVDAGIDTGPVVVQEAVTIEGSWTLEDLETHVHRLEHSLYPRALSVLISEQQTREENDA